MADSQFGDFWSQLNPATLVCDIFLDNGAVLGDDAIP